MVLEGVITSFRLAVAPNIFVGGGEVAHATGIPVCLRDISKMADMAFKYVGAYNACLPMMHV